MPSKNKYPLPYLPGVLVVVIALCAFMAMWASPQRAALATALHSAKTHAAAPVTPLAHK